MEGKSEQGRFNRIRTAKNVCATCPVILDCLEWAVSTNQDFGVWGMCTERERKRIRSMLREHDFDSVTELLESSYAAQAVRELPVLQNLTH